ncbi:MAG: heme-binding domain-containing protein [Chloroflexi bacterium]|nr:heme-binding domain-containing protein [Chloroflexota bacterium]
MLKKLSIAVVAVVVAAFALVQLVPYGRDHANPPVVAEPAWDSPETRSLAKHACFDCHSNETVWPWYSSIAPMSWLAQSDVEQGREEVNYSEWQAGGKGGESAETVQEGGMPPWFYMALHPSARLSAAEKQRLIQGLIATFGAGEGERR